MQMANESIEKAAAAVELTWENDPLWYKDAIIYELHVKAFKDSGDDGIGDFKGLTEKLDYIQDLGVNTLWLLPFYPSPMRDDGYDISDYHNVSPDYGNRNDARIFIREAHRRRLHQALVGGVADGAGHRQAGGEAAVVAQVLLRVADREAEGRQIAFLQRLGCHFQ